MSERRDPNPLFNTDFYLNKYPDVAESKLNPFAHYIMFGYSEGRQCNPYYYKPRELIHLRKEFNKLNYYLPSFYEFRTSIFYDDHSRENLSNINHQPDIYALAVYIAERTQAQYLIDIGCGHGRKLIKTAGDKFDFIGIDYGKNIELCRERYPGGRWIDLNLDEPINLQIPVEVIEQSIIICADVIEHLRYPEYLVFKLYEIAELAKAIILSTPDRARVIGSNKNGPPRNMYHIREWTLDEFVTFLEAAELPVQFSGYTMNNDVNLYKATIMAILQKQRVENYELKYLQELPPLVIISTYNDIDVIECLIEKTLLQGVNVYVIDNWSDDGTYEALLAMNHRLEGLERFPHEGASGYHEWYRMLSRKEEIAARHPGRWIIHQDSDELTFSAWLGLSLAQALNKVDRLGYNVVDLTIINFRPIDDSFKEGDFEVAIPYFEFGNRPGHFVQQKIWKQGADRVALADSGGHQVFFKDKKLCPWKFIRKHYPIRSHQHGIHKIFRERKPRFPKEALARGWHTQYDNFDETSKFIWDQKMLCLFEDKFYEEFLVERLSGIRLY